jgi:hypothetical protein
MFAVTALCIEAIKVAGCSSRVRLLKTSDTSAIASTGQRRILSSEGAGLPGYTGGNKLCLLVLRPSYCFQNIPPISGPCQESHHAQLGRNYRVAG